MREIIFDTETTGLDPYQGHRVVQIGAVEVENFIPTGRTYMTLVNPQRAMEAAAANVHGITDDMLKDQPVFADVVEDFLDFIGDAPLVAHNAEFDMKFINWELKGCGRPVFPADRFVDTLVIARGLFPGQKLSLDALCRRFGIDNSMRERHDALLDCQILAEVYLELRGGRQRGLVLMEAECRPVSADAASGRRRREPRPHAPTPEEAAAHQAFIATLSGSLWLSPEAGKA